MTPNTLRIACIISVLLNVFLIAGVIGGVGWVRTRHPMIAAGSIRIVGTELPKDERRAFRAALRDARLDMRPTVLAGRQARADAAALLTAPTLDQAALSAALTRVRAADFAIRTHVEARAIVFAATLPPEDRAKLADGMAKRRPPMGQR
jgi:uncharacterized membrane protein